MYVFTSFNLTVSFTPWALDPRVAMPCIIISSMFKILASPDFFSADSMISSGSISLSKVQLIVGDILDADFAIEISRA